MGIDARLVLSIFLAIPLLVNAGPGYSPSIFWAAIANDVNMANYYISKGEPINIVDEHGLTPLMYAADKGNYEMVEFLLDAGADPSIRTPSGIVASQMARTDEVRDLLQSRMKIGSNQSPKPTQ